jgi:hypothetical protein
MSGTVRIPKHLKTSTRSWVRRILADYELESHHVKLLLMAAEAYDRAAQAREILQTQGLTFTDRFKQPRARPELAIERNSMITFARLLRELRLDVSPPDDTRPPRLRG